MTLADQRALLLWIVGLPALAAVVVAFVGPERAVVARRLALLASLITLALTVALIIPVGDELANRPAVSDGSPVTFTPLVVPGDPGLRTAQGESPSGRTTWDLIPLNPTGTRTQAIQFYLGLDGLNLWLIALTVVIVPATMLISWRTITDRVNEFYAWILLLETAVVGAFASMDIMLFYVFFELTLIPTFFIIGRWGIGAQRREGARRFFLYTLAGSLLTLVGILGLVVAIAHFSHNPITFSIPQLILDAQAMQSQFASNPQNAADWSRLQSLFFLLLIAGFLVKTPLVPFHSWLPLAYTEAPTAGTVLLSALLAKLGTYGLLRLCLPLTPDAMLAYGVGLLGVLAVIGIIYGAFCAYGQSDIKRVLAYSSISHLGFCVLGLVALNREGLSGATLHMVNHGLTTGALFLLMGMLFERFGSRQVGDYSGLWARMPQYAFFVMVMALASVGLPGLNNFVSEMLMLGGVYNMHDTGGSVTGPMLAIGAAAGIVLGAWYTLTLTKRLLFGPDMEPLAVGTVRDTPDLNGRELATIAPLAVLALVLGVMPQPVLNTMDNDSAVVERLYNQARERAATPTSPR